MEDVNLAVNGQSRVPPGFRFHPTEEELLHYYLRKKVAYEKIDLDVIREVDLNKLEPWDIQEKCRIGSTPQNDWYFFSHKDKKYPTGTRTNRATAAGFWKATGRDKVIYSSSKRIGMRKTLVFYKGRAPHGQKSDWIMHEYRLDDHTDANSQSNASSLMGETMPEEGWVVCRVFKKKSFHKFSDSPKNPSIAGDGHAHILHSSSDGTLDQILQYMGRMCNQEKEPSSSSGSNHHHHNYTNFNSFNTTNHHLNNNIRYLKPIEMNMVTGPHERFMQLPPLESPTIPVISADCQRLDQSCSSQTCYTEAPVTDQSSGVNLNPVYSAEPGICDWASLDRLLSSQLSGQGETSKQMASFNNDPNFTTFCSSHDQDLQLLPHLRSRSFNSNQDCSNDVDFWSFERSTSL